MILFGYPVDNMWNNTCVS